MKTLTMATAAAFLICFTSASLRAQGEFPLKYVEAKENDPLATMGRQLVAAAPEKPPELKVMPKGISGLARYFVLPVAGRQIVAVLDASQPQKLYVDAAGTGDLSGAAPLTAAGFQGQMVFGPAVIPVGDTRSPVVAKVRFRLLNDSIIGAMPAGYVAGEAKLGDKSYRVAFVDANINGRYDDVMTFGADSPGSASDMIAIDLNGDGEFDRSFRRSPEVVPLTPMFQAGGVFYSVKVAADGSSVRIEKADPKMGTIDVGVGDVVLMFFSESGFHRLTGSGGKWQVPAGGYKCVDSTFNRKDASGATWMITDTGELGKLADVEVPAGGTLAVRVGPPLVAKAEARQGAPGGPVEIGLALEGQAGERYAPGVTKNGVRVPPPKYRILDEAGKVVAQGNFEYG
jgi:hypothetical protein